MELKFLDSLKIADLSLAKVNGITTIADELLYYI